MDEFICAVPACGNQHLERGSDFCCWELAKAITEVIQADRNLLREQASLFRVSTSSKGQQKVEILIGQPKSQQEGQRECEGERKGWEELRHGAGTVPQVPHRQGTGMGGTGEDLSRGVGCTMAGGAEGM